MSLWHKFKNNLTKVNLAKTSSYKTVHLAEMKGYCRVSKTKQFETTHFHSTRQAVFGNVFTTSRNYAQGTKIAYDYYLIEQLRLENQILLMYFSKINLTLEKNELEEAAIRIKKFKSMLVGHFYKTTLKLYIYLQYSLQNQSESFSTMRDFRKKKIKTSSMILRYLDRYMNIDKTPELLEECILEFAEIKEILDKRIKQEEKIIYPIYYLLGKVH